MDASDWLLVFNIPVIAIHDIYSKCKGFSLEFIVLYVVLVGSGTDFHKEIQIVVFALKCVNKFISPLWHLFSDCG